MPALIGHEAETRNPEPGLDVEQNLVLWLFRLWRFVHVALSRLTKRGRSYDDRHKSWQGLDLAKTRLYRDVDFVPAIGPVTKLWYDKGIFNNCTVLSHMVSPQILVIGSRGTVGSAIAAAVGNRALKAARSPVGDGCLSFDALVDDADALLSRLSQVPKATVIAFGISGTHACAADPVGSRHLNIDRALATANAAAKVGSLPVILSSDSVFDGTPVAWSEQDEPSPICEYGRQRLALERAVADRGIPHLVVRLSRVIADHANRRDLLFHWCDQMRRGIAIQLPTDQLCTPIAARDVGRIVVQLVDAGVRGLIHVAGPAQVSSLELFKRLQRTCLQLGVNVGGKISLCRVADLPGIEVRPAATMLSIHRLQKVIAPHFTVLDESIHGVVAESFQVGAASLV